MGQRHLAYHKDPLEKASFSVQGYIRRKNGGAYPVSWIEAGSVVRVQDWDKVFFIRSVSYDAQTDTVTLTPDVPPDDIAEMAA